MTTWIRRRFGHRMSAYLDGELDEGESAALGERLVFDATARNGLRGLVAVDRLVCAALALPQRPDPEALLRRLAHQPAAPERARARVHRRRHLAPAVVASVGLLITAGVAIFRLRRRRLA